MLKKMVLGIILMSLLVQTSTMKLHASTYPLLSDLSKPLVVVVVHSSIYPAIESSLEQYVADIENEGFSTSIIETNQLRNETPQTIRSYLKNATSNNLVGALLVGDIPEVWIEMGDERILTDMYYKDLNGLWLDSDGDGVYDKHSGDVSPEIWVGRLKASTIAGDEASLINNYFTKNHRYRKGLLVLPWWRSLAYIDDYGLNWTKDAQHSLSQIHSEVTLVTDPATTTAEDYEIRLRDPFGYEWVYLMCHGSYDYHTFRVPKEQDPSLWDGTIFSWEYQAIDPRAFFYLFFVCSAAEYTKSGYLAGSTVFADTYGLAAIGSTSEIFSVSFLEFFTSLSERKPIGEAFQEWFTEQSEKKFELQEDDRYQTIFYGLAITGDPTLRLYRSQKVLLHDITITSVTTELENTTNKLTLSVTATIENKGNFTETFTFAISLGPYTLRQVQLSLPAKSSTSVSVTVPQSYQIVPADSSKITVKATASMLPEEFNWGDNEEYVEVKGVHAFSLTPDFSPYIMIVVFFIIIISLYALTSMIASERSLILKIWMKMKKHFTKTLSKLRQKTSI